MTRKCHVLLIDDDDNDRLLFSAAIKDTGLDVDLVETADGYAGINYLLSAEHAEFPLPDVVFVDLKMPGMDGFGVLKEIRSQKQFKHLVVNILTNSNLQSDRLAVHALAATAFYQKPGKYEELVGLLQTVLTPWCCVQPDAPKRKPKQT
jgi:Response regulator containing CheY-like receiver, AAA-type ATPase, and DNA-binding domains